MKRLIYAIHNDFSFIIYILHRVWPLARVHEVHPGAGGLVRVATVFCNGKTLYEDCREVSSCPQSVRWSFSYPGVCSGLQGYLKESTHAHLTVVRPARIPEGKHACSFNCRQACKDT